MGFLLAILVCMFLIIFLPVAQMKVIAGVIMISLAALYAMVDHGGIGERDVQNIRVVNNQRVVARLSDEDAIDQRLKRLRKAYYQSRGGAFKQRAFEREMRKIMPACHRYYERMMETEASIFTLLNTGALRNISRKDLLRQVQTMSKQIAIMVEQLQVADLLNGFYEPGIDEDIMVQRTRERLIRRADRAMEVLEGVPARLLQLSTATSNRGMTRLLEDLQQMNERLEGKAQAYERMAADGEISLEELYAHLEAERHLE
jgi:hypothetical protein